MNCMIEDPKNVRAVLDRMKSLDKFVQVSVFA